PFLQGRLRVARHLVQGGKARAPASENEGARGVKAAVEIDGAQDGLARIGENGFSRGTRAQRVALGQADGLAEAKLLGDLRQGLFANERIEPWCQLALARIGIALKEGLGDDETQHTIA